MKAWLEHNLHSLGLAVRTFRAQPFASLFSILVIGIALALPTGLFLALNNIERLAGGLEARPELNLFLKPTLDEARGRQLASQLANHADIAKARFITKQDGLRKLRESGLADLTAGLETNPLPDAIVITVAEADPARMERLADELKKRPEVDRLIIDSDWARRLSALIDFGQELVWLLAILLGVALAAITGNTIRLQIYAAREEIEVSRLIGATDRFIRRPFLYFGALQGLFGGLAGWLIVSGGLFALQSAVSRLAGAWGNQIALAGLGPIESLVLIGSATLLGLLGAFFAVNHSLNKFQ
jgi:cell division transport system permease protein